MIEKFDPQKSCKESIAERLFLVSEDRILVKYHLQENRITASFREFMKPPDFSIEKLSHLKFTKDMTNAYLVFIFYIYKNFITLLFCLFAKIFLTFFLSFNLFRFYIDK